MQLICEQRGKATQRTFASYIIAEVSGVKELQQIILS
jgi:hypothetical protein